LSEREEVSNEQTKVNHRTQKGSGSVFEQGSSDANVIFIALISKNILHNVSGNITVKIGFANYIN
jgi:hypothetical protein